MEMVVAHWHIYKKKKEQASFHSVCIPVLQQGRGEVDLCINAP